MQPDRDRRRAPGGEANRYKPVSLFSRGFSSEMKELKCVCIIQVLLLALDDAVLRTEGKYPTYMYVFARNFFKSN